MEKNSKIFVAGHRGLVGSAILRKLQGEGYKSIIVRSHEELDLTSSNEVEAFFQAEKPEYIFLAAAKVGGIHANSTYSADFYYINSMIQNNVIHNAYKHKVKKLLFLGSSCIYPKLCNQPMKEEELLSGYLEETNEAYAIAKIGGLKMCQYYNLQYDTNFISCMPTNLYGANDNFDLENSHVLPALMRKIHEAKEANAEFVEIWGTGSPLREFLHVDDMAAACVFLMDEYEGMDKDGRVNIHVNIGTAEEISIKELAYLIKDIIGFDGVLNFNTEKPDGMPRKLMDSSKLKRLGWVPEIGLKQGITATYKWYTETNI